MRASIAQQSVEELGGSASVLVRQRQDHEKLNELLHRVRATNGAEQDEVLMRVCRLVFTHAFAEEAVLWPALRRALPDGEALTLQVEREHQEINELVAALDRSRDRDGDRAELIDRAIALLEQDVRDEEDDLFPRLQAALGPRELQRLGRLWEIVRRTAPTRPHPVVARRPPGNVLASLPLSILDRARDVLDDAARRSPSGVAPMHRTASRVLASVAGAVEQVPPLRRGEQRSTRSGRTQRED